MPIRPSFAVSPALQAAAGAAGRRTELNQQAQQNQLQQQRLAEQARQFNVQAALGQQNRIQDRLYDMVRMQQSAALDAEMMRRRAEQQRMLSDQQFQQQRQLYGERDARELQQQFAVEGMGQSRALGNMLNGYNAKGEQIYDPGNLNDQGKQLHNQLNTEFDELNRQFRDGAVRPRDYTYAIDELASRAQSLERFQNPPEISFEDEVKQSTLQVGRMVFKRNEKNGIDLLKQELANPADYPPGRGPGNTWFDPLKGLVKMDIQGNEDVVESIIQVRMDLADKGRELVERLTPNGLSIQEPRWKVDEAASLSDWVTQNLDIAIPSEWMQQQQQAMQPAQAGQAGTPPEQAMQQAMQPQQPAEPEIYAHPAFSSTQPLLPGTQEAQEARGIVREVASLPLTAQSMEQAYKLINRFDGQYRDSQEKMYVDLVIPQLWEPRARDAFIQSIQDTYPQGSVPQHIKGMTRILLQIEQAVQQAEQDAEVAIQEDEVTLGEVVQ